MKRTVVLFILIILVAATTGLWMYTSGFSSNSVLENIHFFVIFLVIAFAGFLGYSRLRSHRRHEPAEDEMTRHRMLQTAAFSYYISLYWWIFLLFIKDRVTIETEVLLGTGILGMAVAFAGTWIFLHLRGARG